MKSHAMTFDLDAGRQRTLLALLAEDQYAPVEVPHAVCAVQSRDCRIVLYRSGKCLVQGKGAAEWVTYVLEPLVLGEARLGYEELLDPAAAEPHMGIDESGKGDFFGPLVIAAVYTDGDTARALREQGVRDSKKVSSDARVLALAEAIRRTVKGAFRLVSIGPESYNRLYASMGNLNRLLAWGHARAIENLLEKVPDCPRALADQFGPADQIRNALMRRGRSLRLEQRPRAESDSAVAAASILARAGFLEGLRALGGQWQVDLPKGASDRVIEAGEALVGRHGPEALLRTAKVHFHTADRILQSRGLDRNVLGAAGRAVSRSRRVAPDTEESRETPGQRKEQES